MKQPLLFCGRWVAVVLLVLVWVALVPLLELLRTSGVEEPDDTSFTGRGGVDARVVRVERPSNPYLSAYPQ